MHTYTQLKAVFVEIIGAEKLMIFGSFARFAPSRVLARFRVLSEYVSERFQNQNVFISPHQT